MGYSAAAAVAEARRWVGFHEGYANNNPFSAWQYGSYRQPWCASYTAYCSYQAGFRFPYYCSYGERGDANVGAVHYHAIRQGIWRERWVTARPGWLVVLTFGIPDQHIEMVFADAGGNVATIGGNTSDMVAYRTRYRSNIVGFVALDEAGQSSATDGPMPSPLPPPEVLKMFVAIKETKSGHGYYCLKDDGSVFAYGDAKHHGGLYGIKLAAPVIDIAVRPSNKGYLLAAADGGIFAFGDAKFHGSMAGHKLDAPVTAIAALRNNLGYWLIAGDGGIFTFGAAKFLGRPH